MHEIKAAIKEKIAPYLKRNECIYALCQTFAALLLSCGVRIYGIAPSGVAAVAGAWIYGDAPVFALIGAIIGSLIRRDYASACAAVIFVASVLFLYALRGVVYKGHKIAMLIVSQLIVLPIFYGSGINSFMTGFANMSLTFFSALLISKALSGINRMRRDRIPSEREHTSFVFLGAMAIYAIGGTAISQISLGAVMSALFSMAAAKCRGLSSAAAALILGMAYVFGAGDDVLFIGILCVCTLLASMAASYGKWGVPCVFVLVAFTAALFSETHKVFIWEALIAASIFAFLPQSLLHRLEIYSQGSEGVRAEKELLTMQVKLRDAASVIDAVADMFSKTSDVKVRLANRQLAAASSLMLRIAEGSGNKGKRRYKVSIGAAACPKAGNEETGDSIGMRELGTSVLMVLSDGMGSGMRAHKESAAAVALLSDLLAVGFELNEALECVNMLMIQRSEKDMYATMDALELDLVNAAARFVKQGAPPSYVVRGNKVFTMYSEALPVGILPQARPALHMLNLNRGDIVLLMTDGISEALNSLLPDILIDITLQYDNVDAMAEGLLLAARELSDKDDMSVIVAQIL